jgi:hypothetical protein
MATHHGEPRKMDDRMTTTANELGEKEEKEKQDKKIIVFEFKKIKFLSRGLYSIFTAKNS